MVLIGRDAARLERIAADLKTRGAGSDIRAVTVDFLDPEAIRAVADDVAQTAVDIVFIAHGMLPEQDACQNDLSACREALEVNGVSPVLFAEAFARTMEKNGRGTIALTGSVAGDRGRKSNYVYGSAKGMIERYAQGLQHRFAGTGINVVLVKPGPTDTPMTARLKDTGTRLAPVASVARRIARAIDKGVPVVYAPCRWSVIMWVVRHLPGVIFRKLDI
jgi:short-subunit dehydrogenase